MGAAHRGLSRTSAQLALTSKAGTVTTELLMSLSISVSAATPPSTASPTVVVTGAMDLGSVDEVDLVMAALDQTVYQTAEITTGGYSTGTSYELTGPKFSSYTLAYPTGAQFVMAAQKLSVSSPSVAPTSGTIPARGANLITNPGADAGRGVTASSSVFPVPGWETTGGFTAAAYAWPDGDLSTT